MDAPTFPSLRRPITADMVRLYAKVNGDRNMIHYDDDVARAAGFPRAIVHGAITAAVISEACREHFGPSWIGGGRLAVKFIKPLLVGENISTHGRLTGEAVDGDVRRETWEVWCQNEAGERVLVGEARGVISG